jgi:hypothetical protein
MQSTSTPTAEPRPVAEHLDHIRLLQQSVASATRALLIRQGWRRTRMNPARLWLWSKQFPDGRTILTDLGTAIAFECALAHEPPLDRAHRPDRRP